MHKEIVGILEIDHPGLSDEQIREIELAEDKSSVTLPCGKSLAVYISEVEELKEWRAREREEASAAAAATGKPKVTRHKPKKEEVKEVSEQPEKNPEND